MGESISEEFLFQVPCSKSNIVKSQKFMLPHFLTTDGILLSRDMQSPPMYGPRGTTIPSKLLDSYKNNSPIREFCCGTCNRKFQSFLQLSEHCSDDQKCSFDEGTFNRHFSDMTEHIEQHRNFGLFETLGNLNTPEDIVKWRNDRKRNYPTRSNVELRQKMQKAKLKRGEKLNDSNGRLQKMICRKVETKRKCVKRRLRKSESIGERKETVNVQLTKCQANCNGSLHMFQGTGNIINYRESINKIVPNPLMNFIGMYGTDEESEEEKNRITKEQFEHDNRQRTFEGRLSSSNIRETDREHPVEQCLEQFENNDKQNCYGEIHVNIFSEDEMPDEYSFQRVKEKLITDITRSPDRKQNHKLKVNNIKTKIVKPRTLLDYSKLKKTRQNTMLEKLLQADIRHERNILLQCIKYVVENNFFGNK